MLLMGEWLYDHEEQAMTLEEYINKEPRRPSSLRNKIYIQPIGDFDTISFQIIIKTADFLHAFFGLEVKINDPLASDIIPKKEQRFWDEKQQWKTGYILHKILKPNLPTDAIVMLALTDHDLYPADDWNFVFGQASLKDGVGVWSYFRMGSPYSPESAQLEFKKRVLKTAGHETLHMFSIKHCVTFNCLLNGSNGEYESDQNPLYLCPLCLSKLCWNLNIDPAIHLQRMADFWQKEKIFYTSNFYKKCLKYVKENSDEK
jgi:archaemetzincin